MALNVARAKDKARNFEVKNQTEKAIETYVEILRHLEDTPELDDELALFNKVGDLYQKVGNVHAAVDMWERGAGYYADGGFYNNAIALCNKILRNAPGRTQVYLTLAKLMLGRGFIAEAKQNLLEYAERMKRAGQLEAAFKALGEFADLSSGNSEEIRLMLAEQLKLAGLEYEARDQLAKLFHEAKGDARRSRATIDKIRAIDPGYDAASAPPPKDKSRPEKSSDLVFLDLDEAPPPREPARASGRRPAPAPRPPEPEPLEEAPEPPPLEIEPTALVEEPPELAPEEIPVERASVEFDSGGVEAGTMEGLSGRMVEPPVDTAPPVEFEPTAVEPPILEPADEEPGLGVVPDLNLSPFGETAPAEAPGRRPSAGLPAMDLDLDIGSFPAAPAGAPDVATLEAQVAADPDDPQLHQSLAEALVESGGRERGLEELDIALGLLEGKNEWNQAEDVADEILRLDPNSVRHHQKRVEYAFRRKDKSRLIDAYLGLSDALMRSGALDRARAVYQRVLEHDTKNARALSALATLEPPPAEPKPAKGVKLAAPVPATAADFVDLGALVLDEPVNLGDARLRVQDEEPTGDEQRDFEDMLAQFKKGIEASLGAEDVQAHYDLGIAFKEMGLVDEAIAEFQKALRGAEGRLRTSEALGSCFFEKGQYTVATTVLRRAVESDPGGDEAKIGLLYWLGRCEEEMGRGAEALTYYQRVFAVEIGFQDVRARVNSLTKVGR